MSTYQCAVSPENTAMDVGYASRRGKSLKHHVHLNLFFGLKSVPPLLDALRPEHILALDICACGTDHRMPLPRIRFYDAPPHRSDSELLVTWNLEDPIESVEGPIRMVGFFGIVPTAWDWECLSISQASRVTQRPHDEKLTG
jgi:hypothetical protein